MFGFTQEKVEEAALGGMSNSKGVPAGPPTSHLSEFTPLKETQPWKFFFWAVTSLWQFTAGEIQEAELLAEQNSLPKQIFDTANKEFEDEGAAIQQFQAHLYDPCAQSSGIILLQVLGRLKEVTKLELQNFKIFLSTSAAGAFLLSVILLRSWWILEKFAEVIPYATLDLQFAQQLFGVLIVIFVAKQILEIKNLLKFNLMEIGRMRFSLTTGNVAQILMRLETKVSYVELRTMTFEVKFHHLKRHFEQDVLEIE